MADKNFDEEFASNGDGEGHTFTLAGQVFRTKPVAPPNAFLADNRGLAASIHFLDQVLMPEDKERFHKLLDDESKKDRPDVSAYLIDQIAVWLIGETSGRPTT